MVARLWITKWDFEKVVECFNCHKVAAQRVEVIPTETVVTCLNCGAERRYVIHGFFVADKKPDYEPTGPGGSMISGSSPVARSAPIA